MKNALLISCLLFSITALAQHCPWHGGRILIVQATSNQQPVEGLKITLLNSNRKHFKPPYTYENSKAFLPNTPKSENVQMPWSYLNDSTSHFPFAGNSYVRITSNGLIAHYSKFIVKIEDVDGEQNGGHFETAYVRIATENFLYICTSEESTWHNEEHVQKRIINVPLKKNN